MLIDDYRRVGALRRLGRDTVGVEQWSCDLTTVMLRMLARTQDCAFASIEEALLLRALGGRARTVAAEPAQLCTITRHARPRTRGHET